MTLNQSPAVLIVMYKRFENLNKILQIALSSGVTRFYISVDAVHDENNEIRQSQLLQIIKEVCQGRDVMVQLRLSESNMGCSASVLSACDWIFSHEDFAVILEDDCIPTPDFFKFVLHGYSILKANEETWLLCGTQFAPVQATNNIWMTSKYALIWGWATTREKWQVISNVFTDFKNVSFKNLRTLPEIAFWNSGARRASTGWVDAWDTVLVQQMLAKGKTAVLPGMNLVQNVGNDEFATHTKENSKWLNFATQKYQICTTNPSPNVKVDKWLETNFYCINYSHLLRFIASYIRDILFKRKKFRPGLKERRNSAKLVNFIYWQTS